MCVFLGGGSGGSTADLSPPPPSGTFTFMFREETKMAREKEGGGARILRLTVTGITEGGGGSDFLSSS